MCVNIMYVLTLKLYFPTDCCCYIGKLNVNICNLKMLAL